MLSDVQQIAAATAALVASPCVLTSAILALAEKLLFAFIDICKWQAEKASHERNQEAEIVASLEPSLCWIN
jgi:hypothetical protein